MYVHSKEKTRQMDDPVKIAIQFIFWLRANGYFAVYVFRQNVN